MYRASVSAPANVRLSSGFRKRGAGQTATEIREQQRRGGAPVHLLILQKVSITLVLEKVSICALTNLKFTHLHLRLESSSAEAFDDAETQRRAAQATWRRHVPFAVKPLREAAVAVDSVESVLIRTRKPLSWTLTSTSGCGNGC